MIKKKFSKYENYLFSLKNKYLSVFLVAVN